MPAHWQIPLHGPVGVDVPVEAPHAVVSRWLDADHRAATKPYAICPPVVRGDLTRLDVRLLDDALADRLVVAAAPGAQVRLGRHVFSVSELPRRVDGVSWRTLAGSGEPPARSWWLRFLTPTTFRRRDRSSPWPAPESVIRSLADRWRALAPPSVPEFSPAPGTLWVADLDGSSVAVRRTGMLVSGFVGEIRYVCDGSDSDAAAIGALFRFAAYAGVGSHTAFGFGVAAVEPVGAPARLAYTG